jgi:hypothetical protein
VVAAASSWSTAAGLKPPPTIAQLPHGQPTPTPQQDESGGGLNLAGGCITFLTEDLEATKAVYAEVFGLPLAFEDDASTVFPLGNTSRVDGPLKPSPDRVDASV